MRIWFSLVALMLVAGPAQAFDCAKAATAVEKAICGEDALKLLDERMSQAYGVVRKLSTEAERPMLARSQKAWIRERESNCPTSEAGIFACVTDMTRERLTLFEGRPESGTAPAGRIIPVFIVQEGTAEVYELDVTLLRFADAATPGEKRLNAIADEIKARVRTGKHGEDTMDRVYSMIEAMSFRFAAPQLYSVEHSFWSFTGGAHGNGGTQNFNFDPVTGKDYTIDDFFPEPAVMQLIASCKEKIIAEKKTRWGSEPYDPAQDFFMQDGVIGEHVSTFSRWSFNADGASVNFDSYAIGSYAEGTYACTFPTAKLKALARPDAPLP
jgi:uncharacterized protein YecT (DUF1311 family)